MKYKIKTVETELVVVGAGFPGICTAIQAARMGVQVALINDRSVLGGNASCEIRVSVNGAVDCAPLNLNSREGGLVSEMLLECKYRSIDMNRYIWDTVLQDFVDKETNITVYLNTCIDDVAVNSDGAIAHVSGTQNSTETRCVFSGRWFVDATGDGTLGALSGAEYMLGREAKKTFGERFAPDEADAHVIPSTLMWFAKDTGRPVRFVAPDFALDLEQTRILEHRIIPHNKMQVQWYYEIGGDYDHVKDQEIISKELKALTYGIWNYIKNSGKYPEAECYDLEFVACIPGTREYRRLVGDHILTQNDIEQQAYFDDAVGHGGWNIDLHAIYGIWDTDIVNRHIFLKGIYQIPYRCGYSKTVKNLFMSGRCLSATHAAFGSTRVIATLATLGQAVGMAAGLCKKYQINPRDVYESHRTELQQRLLAADQLIIGLQNQDQLDLAQKAMPGASSTAKLDLSVVSGRLLQTGCKDTDPGEVVSLDQSIGFSLPVRQRLDVFSICIRAKESTELTYRVYQPLRKENYGPEKLLLEHAVTVAAADHFQWVSLPVDVSTQDRFLFIELTENDALDLALAEQALPTTQMFRKTVNELENICEIESMQKAAYTWQRSESCLCFKTKPEQHVYVTQNVINGFHFPYGQPNMWLSCTADKEPQFRLKWPQPVQIQRIVITFAIDMTRRMYHDINQEIMPLIGQNFKVLAGKEQIEIAVVTGNHRKVCALSFHETETDELTFAFATRENEQIGIYEIRVY